jgi:hypothetical protein
VSGERRHLLVAGTAFELELEPDTIYVLGRAGSHPGYRVRYREAGRRRWHSVLLVDHDHEPTDAELGAAIVFHKTGRLAEPADAAIEQQAPHGG